MSKFHDDFVIGIDVASEFSMVAMLEPSGALIRKPFKVLHTTEGFKKFLKILKKEEERLNKKPIYFVESTGIFHLPLFFFLRSNDLKGFVLNPLSVHFTKNLDIRKVKNDKRDAKTIATLVKYQDIKLSLVPEPQILALRFIARDYYKQTDMLIEVKNRMTTDLKLIFPGYDKVFANIFCKSSIAVLRAYPTPSQLLGCNRNALVSMIKRISRKGVKWAYNKADALIQCAHAALDMLCGLPFISSKIVYHLDAIECFQKNIEAILAQLKAIISSDDFPPQAKRQVELMKEMPGVGFISAVTLLAEMGDFKRFTSAKTLTAFFGLDPSVNESGKFKGCHNKISKRGTYLGRRVFFTIAMVSISTTKNGKPINPILREFYQRKCKSKKKKVALAAVMHKLVHYIFAMLRDDKAYEFRKPEDHHTWRHKVLKLVA